MFPYTNRVVKGVPTLSEKAYIEISRMDEALALFGTFDENAKTIEQELDVVVRTGDMQIVVQGEEENARLGQLVVQGLLQLLERGETIDKARIRYAVDLAREGNAALIAELGNDVVAFTHRGKQIKTKTLGQKQYIRAIADHTVTFGIGPAGTGKTYLAVAMAVRAFKNKQIEKIILTRPAVEAGEKLGFLPGDLQNKVDPYLRPLYDALFEFLGNENFRTLSEKGVIEVAPLAYMRGRTLNHAFIILDEAQNTSIEQMKMFLTRFGEGSHVVVTGDVTQIDLPNGRQSGLIHAERVLQGVEGLAIIRLTHKDVVRHEMVQRIIMAYDKAEKNRQMRFHQGKGVSLQRKP